MTKNEFLEETKRRRFHFFLAFVGWLIAGPIFGYLYSLILDLNNAVVASLATWLVLMLFLQYRIKQLKCYKCGKQAFKSALFFMKNAKCKNCGIKYCA